MHDDFNISRFEIEQPASLNDLKSLIHERGGVHRDALPHLPRWVVQGLGGRNVRHLRDRGVPKRTAGRSENQLHRLGSAPGPQALVGAVVLAINRADAPVPRLNWREARSWEFFPTDFDKFPLLRLAYQAQEAQNSSTCSLNAADEIAVEAFLNEQISFTGITEVVAETLNRVPARTPGSVAEVLEIDRESRAMARECVRERAAVQA